MNENKFQYTYDAKEEKAIRQIVARYAQYENSNYREIRRLNKEAERPAKLAFWVVFVASILLFGSGLSLVLAFSFVIFGAVVGTLGIIAIIFSFRLRAFLLEKRRKEYAPRILALVRKTENIDKPLLD